MYQSNMSWGIKLPSDLRWFSCLKILSPIMLHAVIHLRGGGHALYRQLPIVTAVV